MPEFLGRRKGYAFKNCMCAVRGFHMLLLTSGLEFFCEMYSLLEKYEDTVFSMKRALERHEELTWSSSFI